jgi:drug/metabolite transporter (DMT)-like permease
LSPAGALAGGPAAIDYSSSGMLLLAATIGLEFYLVAILVRIGGAVVTSCGDFIALLAGLAWSHLIFGETPTMAMALAALIGAAAIKLTASGALQES